MLAKKQTQEAVDAFRLEGSKQSLGLSHPVIYNTIVQLMEKFNVDKGHLLDFGAGRGDFLKVLAPKNQYTLHGVDLMFTNIPQVNWYVQDLNKQLQFKQNQFEAVTSIEVIEHLENPRQMVRDIFRCLKPGGRMFVSTPNNESWRSLLSYVSRGHFVAFTETSYPAHITALNRADLRRIAEECGFQNIEFHYTNCGMVPKMPGLTWQKISLGMCRGVRYSDNLVMTAVKP